MSTRYTVKQAAQLACVSVRTLHHYDAIGLLRPSARTAAGYRLYSTDDMKRLQEILVFRELGFTLHSIQRLLDDPLLDRRAALEAQRTHVLADVQKRTAVLRAIDAAIRGLEGDTTMSVNEMFDGFNSFDHAQYEQEAQERWGETESYRESARRTKSYTKADWARVRAEGEAHLDAWVALRAQGVAATAEPAMDVAEQARLHIDRWFYPLTHEAHACLADMYVADERFTAYYERRSPGLAQYVADSIRANAARAGA